MTVKTGIVEHLGEKAILVPDLLAGALQANDRAKLRMTVLQEAVAHARHPEAGVRSLSGELRAAGMDDPALEESIRGARLLPEDAVLVPGADDLVSGLRGDIEAMIAPLDAVAAPSAADFSARLQQLRLEEFSGETVGDAEIATLTSANREGRDTAHLLVMDLHKALNKLSTEVSVETLAGAHVLHIADDDRPRIRAFMRGVDRTRGLAFGHPGLGTTAARSGERLVIQNDIGTTDAHVLVVAVEAGTVTITYTDIHLRRAQFFVGLFDSWKMDWVPLAERKARGLAEGAAFFLVTGSYTSRDENDCQAFLEYLGSRIVFLIDWNKARKALQPFVSKSEAVRLLRQAAAEDYGHRGFLELGGAELLFDAIQRSAEGRIPYGTRLDAALGATQAYDLLARVMRLSSQGLAQRRSARLLRDEVRAELTQCVVSVEREILDIVLRQLGLARDLASMIQDALSDGRGLNREAAQRLSQRAKHLEAKADVLTVRAREMAEGPMGRGLRFLPIVNGIEDAVDELEEAVFVLSIAPDHVATETIARPLGELARTAVECCSGLVRAVAAALQAPAGNRRDTADTLEGIEDAVQAEKQADAAQRAAIAGFIADIDCARTLTVGVETARAIETSTDRIAHAALVLRHCVLDDLAPWKS
ncbi:uncharacterized protein Yka (UPF0111/DUF47 family) [Pseudochelatococcus lubricantis]|uniref:Uncharacterized protein Yka (UPF0111/DUF47 family) n=1 Tax=Pseudochelatococcus lubricantis TaxID=1538102 RepID=A0ABX0UWW5_9HYPH|nr:hypothetical protein [Pseudochelatococcus lubricantis]NIJ57437.1 uncharacterized protein Yka (UPF0111/DUF47 family) [Pseudochelatococcus lubricantis]